MTTKLNTGVVDCVDCVVVVDVGTLGGGVPVSVNLS